MTQTQIKQTLRDSKAARWSVLALVSFTMLCGYFLTDIMAPMKNMLEEILGWSSVEYGLFTSAYGWFNIFLGMLIIGGIILDKLGPRFTGILSVGFMIAGCALKYYAVAGFIDPEAILWKWKLQVIVAAVGFAIFGVGIETAGITVTKVIARWFKGKEIALAMGLQVAVARLGTGLALSTTIPIAIRFSLSTPVLLGLILLCIGLLAYLVFCVMDKKLDKSLEANLYEPEEPFRLSDIGIILKNRGFWLIAILCVLFYSAVFPFLKYATELMIHKYRVDPELAGIIPAILPFGAILLTPVFGSIYDRKGKGATIMVYGSVMLIGVHLLFTLPFLNYWWFAGIVMLVLGVAFSLVPSAMWPSVPKIIPERQLGSAYALIFYIQNIGLSMVPLLIGFVLDNYCKLDSAGGRTTYDYTLPMAIFTLFGLLALGVALLLKAEDRKKGYGLEEANIKK
ncbi:MAG: MFS transporter [Bacteroides sp.]|nr:MFS transporter [Bacteroides sp.]